MVGGFFFNLGRSFLFFFPFGFCQFQLGFRLSFLGLALGLGLVVFIFVVEEGWSGGDGFFVVGDCFVSDFTSTDLGVVLEVTFVVFLVVFVVVVVVFVVVVDVVVFLGSDFFDVLNVVVVVFLVVDLSEEGCF